MPIATAQSSAILRAINWLVTLATGPLATTVAIIAIALIGFAMLNGRIDWRRGAATIAGCFILFGAPAIAEAFNNLARSDVAAGPDRISSQAIAEAPQTPPQQDPYSGASIIR